MFPSYNTSWVGVRGPHHRLDFHQQPGRPLPGLKIYHDADHTVVITNGSTNSQKLPICKLDKEQILARIEMKTEIWVPFLLQSQPHNEAERGGSVGLLPLRLHLSWAVLLHARTQAFTWSRRSCPIGDAFGNWQDCFPAISNCGLHAPPPQPSHQVGVLLQVQLLSLRECDLINRYPGRFLRWRRWWKSCANWPPIGQRKESHFHWWYLTPFHEPLNQCQI